MEQALSLSEATYYILIALRAPNHGYGIIQEVGTLTRGRLVLGAGTLYGAIQSMLSKQWIRLYSEETTSRKKKEYLITEKGYEVFCGEQVRLQEMLKHAELMHSIERGGDAP